MISERGNFMKVITIKQPFATLIVEGIKKYEFRTWKTNYRGEIFIHAGKGVDKEAMKKYAHFHFDYPSGCIIGKATLTDCIKIDKEARDMLANKKSIVYDRVIHDVMWEGYGFKLENVCKIKPIYMNGKLGLWNYDK